MHCAHRAAWTQSWAAALRRRRAGDTELEGLRKCPPTEYEFEQHEFKQYEFKQHEFRLSRLSHARVCCFNFGSGSVRRVEYITFIMLNINYVMYRTRVAQCVVGPVGPIQCCVPGSCAGPTSPAARARWAGLDTSRLASPRLASPRRRRRRRRILRCVKHIPAEKRIMILLEYIIHSIFRLSLHHDCMRDWYRP